MNTHTRRTATLCAGVLLGSIQLAAVAGGGGVAGADPVVDTFRQTVTDDGWTLTISKTGENLDRRPNRANSPLSREGVVAVKAAAEVAGVNLPDAVNGTLTLSYQIGCAVDVSSGLRLGVGASLGGNAGVAVSGATLGARASLTPNISATLVPGKVSTIEIGKKPLTASRGSITAEGVTIKVDACLGPVTMRSVTAATISTSTADSTVTVYGDTVEL